MKLYTISLLEKRTLLRQRPHVPRIGSAAPVLTYGALNGILFVSYNQTLRWPEKSNHFSASPLLSRWLAGAVGGFATWVVSAPTEVIKCRAQISDVGKSSFIVAREIWKRDGVKGLYRAGGITSVRDAVGYGF